jgi:outer membrane protein OmpA-like peptidoglycan-associated protein
MRASVRLTLLTVVTAVAAACSGSPARPIGSARQIAPAALGSGADRARHVAALLSDGTVLLAGGLVGTDAVQSAEIFDPSTGLVTGTGALNQPHVDAAAVLLGDGQVLVVGGEDASGKPSSSVELYDPGTGLFTEVESLLAPRAAHTATRLADGTVLVTGGVGGSGVLLSTERYDPAASEGAAWSDGPPLQAGRAHHTATLFPDGRLLVVGGEDFAGNPVTPHEAEWLVGGVGGDFVDGPGVPPTARTRHTATLLGTGEDVLVVGGSDGTGALENAELYDHITGDFGLTVAQPGAARMDHTATLLPEGTVVVTGGQSGGAAVSSVEVYRTNGTFLPGGTTAVPRVGHVATLLASGRVLLTGGGSGAATPELLDRARDAWTPLTLPATGPVPVPRHGHTATLLVTGPNAGRVLLVGGIDPYSAYLNTAQLYDPGTGLLLNVGIPAMATARAFHTAVVLPDGNVLVAGGTTGTLTLDSAQVYDPVANSWSPVLHMAERRAYHTATALPGGPILVAGGENNGTDLATAELYDPAAQAFSAPIAMTSPRSHHAAALLQDGTVLLAGGDDGAAALASAERFDPVTGQFAAAGTMSSARAGLTATPLASGEVLVAGGLPAGAPADTAELFRPGSGFTPITAGTIPARAGHTATTLPGGTVLVAGGLDADGEVQDAQQYDPATNRFSVADAFASGAGRSAHTATLLPTGEVLAWGGVGTDRSTLGVLYHPSAFAPRPTPDLTGSLPRRVPGAALNLVAAGSFLGDSEAASGDSRSSAANHPVVELERQGGDGLAFARVTSFSSGGTTAVLPDTLLPGWWWARVIVAGVPGKALPFFVLPPFHISPDPASTPPRGSLSFTATGGSGSAYQWSFQGPSGNPSSGTIDKDTGLYTAGTTGSVTDVVRVDDSSGNFATVEVAVGVGVSVAPLDPVIPPRGTVAFSATGGSGTGWQWSFAPGENRSGGTVDAGTGAYQAGSGSGVVDTIQVRDALGNTATTTVTVTEPLTAAPVGPLTVFPGQSVHFATAGGSGVGVTWTLTTNGSRGTVVPVAGTPGEADYTAGRTGNAADVLHAQDSVGNAVDVQIHVLPGVTVAPDAPSTPPGGPLAFTATGGSGTGYVWEVLTNGSGAVVDPGTGAYTAGHTPSVVDVVRVTDDLGNVATATVTVGAGITITPREPGAYPGQTVALTATGGSGTGWVWSMVETNSNGGAVDANGVYTAGTQRGAIDLVKVVDSLGNEATVDVAVWPDWQAKGSGCGSAGGGTGLLGLLALALLLALRGRNNLRRTLARAVLALVAFAGAARAQTPPATTEFVVQRFQPSGGAFDVLTVESAQVAGHLDRSIQLWANYGHRPLIVVAPGVKDAALLRSQTGLDLALSVGLADWAEVSAAVSGVAAQQREENRLLPPNLRPAISSSGVSDVRLAPKVRLLEYRGVRVGLAVPVSFPTGRKDSYLGQGGFTYGPKALVELDALGPVRVLLNGGAVFREERKLVELTVGNAYTYGAGLEWSLTQKLSAVGSLAGEVGMKDHSAAARPMEALGGLRWQARSGFHFTVGGGPGVGDGYGTPQYRVFAELGYTSADPHRLDRREPPPRPEPEVVAKKEEPKPEPAPVKEEPKPEPRPEVVVAKAEAPAEEDVPAPEVVDGELRIDARIYFAFNRKEIKAQFQPVLEQIAARIVAEPRMKMVRIEGHADDLGPPEYNVWLSLERAKAVQAFLVGHGVPAKRVVIVGYGKTHPAEKGTSRVVRAKNRRVEFNVQEK